MHFRVSNKKIFKFWELGKFLGRKTFKTFCTFKSADNSRRTAVTENSMKDLRRFYWCFTNTIVIIFYDIRKLVKRKLCAFFNYFFQVATHNIRMLWIYRHFRENLYEFLSIVTYIMSIAHKKVTTPQSVWFSYLGDI